MIDKDFVEYNEFGNSREYYPLIKKNRLFFKHVNGLITNFFNNSASQFLPSSQKQFIISRIRNLKKIIDSELQKRKMIDFIIKSTLSLSVLLAVYHSGKRENTSVQ
jgi:hypothetical protein